MRKTQKRLAKARPRWLFSALEETSLPPGQESSPPDWEHLPGLLGLRLTARLLGVHPNTLRDWDRRGILRAVRIGPRRDRRYERLAVRAHWQQPRNSPDRARPMRAVFRRAWGVALTTIVVGVFGLSVVAIAKAGSDPSKLTFLPESCHGWVGESRAIVIDLNPGSSRSSFNPQNSAIIRSDRLFLQGSLGQGTGILTGSLETPNPDVLCRRFLAPGLSGQEQVSGATAELSLTSSGAADSTDSVILESSLNGGPWQLLAARAANDPPAEYWRVNLPDIRRVEDLRQARFRLRLEFAPRLPPTVIHLDGMRIEAEVSRPSAALTPEEREAKQRLERLVALSKRLYRSVEQPVMTVPKRKVNRFLFFRTGEERWELERLRLIDASGREQTVSYRAVDTPAGDDLDSTLYLDMGSLHAGKYRLRVTMVRSDGAEATIEKEFLWGVVALNVTRATPQLGQEQVAAMAVLDDDGRTICNADLTLAVTDPDGRMKRYRTSDDTISKNPDCVDKGVTYKPDYAAMFKVERQGVYHLRLEADTDFGRRVLEDNFTVEEAVPFDVHRATYPTRIYPVADYSVRIAVTPRRDYIGTVQETVPRDFAISKLLPEGQTRASPDDRRSQLVEWEVKWSKGETYFLSYTFDAPDVSPALFRTGPLRIGGSFTAASLYQEPRQWQLASDAVANNGRLLYGDVTSLGQVNAQVLTSTFSFGGEIVGSATSSSSRIAFIVAKAAPTRDEIIIAHLKEDGRLDAVRGTNGSDAAGDFAAAWNVVNANPAMTCSGTEADCTRTFDLDYESLAGRAMVVYSADSQDAGTVVDNQKLFYCYWDGANWGPVSNCAATTGSNDITLSSNGRPTFVSLKAKPNSNEILLGVSVDVSGTHEVDAAIWSGSAWGTVTNITSTTNASTLGLEKGSVFDVAWETNSGNALVAWGTTSAGSTKYQLYTGSWGGEQTGPALVGGDGVVQGVNLARDPKSNRIAWASNDSLNDGNFGIWKADGSTAGWTMGNEDATLENQEVGPEYTDVIWETFNAGGDSVAMWAAQNAAGAPDPEYQTATCNGTGCTFSSIDTTMATCTGDDALFNRIFRSPNSDDLMLLVADIDRNLMAQHWSGSAWESTAACALETDISGAAGDNTIYNSRPATFEYIPYSAWSRNWKFFDGADTTDTPTTQLANENTVPTDFDYAAGKFRLRFSVAELSGEGQTDARKKLQYTTNDPDSTSATWTDVDDPTGGGIWRYVDCNGGSSVCNDNTALAGTTLSGSPTAGWWTLDKDAACPANCGNMDQSALQLRELEFSVEANSAAQGTTYYFRMFDIDQNGAVLREQDNDGSNDCATATCTYPSLTTVLTITVSGGCFTDETEITACTDDGANEIKVAVNGVPQSASAADVDGAWSFTINKPSSGATMIFFINGEATESEEATTVTKYDGDGGNVDVVQLYQSQLVIGTGVDSDNSDQTIANTDLDDYTNTNDEDVIYGVATNDLTVDQEANKTEQLYIMYGDTYRPGSGGGADVTTHHLKFDTSTFTTDNNFIYVAGNFVDDGTFTSSTSTLTFNGSDPQTFNTGTSAFYHVTLNNTGTDGSDDNVTIAGAGALNVDGNFNITNGDLILNSGNPTVNTAGDVTIGASAFVTKGTGTWTFDGTTAATYTDSTSTPQNIGAVVFNKTSGVGANDKVTLASSMTVDTADIQTGDTLDLANSGYTLTLANAGATATVLTITGTLTPNTSSTVKYSATNSGGAISVASDSGGTTYASLELAGSETYNLTANMTGTNGLEGNLTIASGATLDVTGSNYNIDLAGNWDNDGTFTIGTSTVTFDAASGTKTIDARGLAAPDFYAVTFNDAGGTATFQLTTAFDANNNVTITGGTLDANGNNLNVGGNWDNDDTFTISTSTVTFDATAAGTKTIDARGLAAPDFYGVIFNDGAQEVTFQLTTAFDANDNVTITDGTFDANGNNITVGGNWDNNDLFTAGAGTLTFDAPDSGNTVESGSSSFSNVTFAGSDGSGGFTIQTNNPTVTGTLNVDTSDVITLASVTLTHSGATLTLNGTIAHSGSGLFVYQSATAFPTSGVLTANMRFDATNNDQTIGTRTSGAPYGGTVEVYSNSTSDRTVAGNAGSPSFSSNFTLNAANTGDLTVDADTNDPTVSITGDLDFTGGAAGDEIILAGTNSWTVSGNVDLTSGIYAEGVKTLTPSWDITAVRTVDLDGLCEIIGTTYSCEAGTDATLLTSVELGSCGPSDDKYYRDAMKFSLTTVPNTAKVVNTELRLNVIATTANSLDLFTVNSDSPDTISCTSAGSSLYEKLAENSTLLTVTDHTTTGWKLYDLGTTADANVEASLPDGDDIIAFGVRHNGAANDPGSFASVDSANDPELRVYYVAAATLVMNGTSKTLTSGGNSLSSFTVSGGTVSLGDTASIQGDVAVTGGTFTQGQTITVTGDIAVSTGATYKVNATATVNGGAFTSTGTGSITTDAGTGTLTMSGTGNLGGGALTTVYALTQSSGTTTVASALTVNNTLTVTGTLNGSNNVTAKGNVTGAGTITMTGGSFQQRVSANQNFGASSGTNTWTFSDLNFSNSVAATTKTISMNAGTGSTIKVDSILSIGDGTTALVVLDNDTSNDHPIDAVDVTIETNNTLTASSTQSFAVSGAWTNLGTLNEGTGTVTFDGATSVTLDSGCTNVSTCTTQNFYNLKIDKSDASDANDNLTLDTNGIRVTNTLTIADGELIQGTLNVRAQGSAAVVIEGGASPGKWSNTSTGDIILGGTFDNAGTAVLQGTTTACSEADEIAITSTVGGTQRNWLGAGTYTLNDLNVTDMTSTPTITTYSSTFSNVGANWVKTGCPISVAGTVFKSDESTAGTVGNGGPCNGASELTIKVYDAGTLLTTDTGSCSGADATFSINTYVESGSSVYLYLTTSQKGNVVYTSDATNDAGIDLYVNTLTARHENAGPLAIVNMDDYDNDQDAPNMLYDAEDAAPDTLVVDDGIELHVWTGDTFTPGGTVTTDVSNDGTDTVKDGDIHIDGTGVLTMATNALSVGGDFNNEGTFNKTNPQTTTFTATATGHTVTDGGENFDNVTYNGTGGGWSFADATTIDVDLTMTAGTLSGTANIDVLGGDATGNGMINLTGGTFTLRGTGNWGGSSSNWTFSGLTFGNGTAETTTGSNGAGNITVTGVMTITASHVLNAGGETYTLSGTGTPLVETGTYTHQNGTITYTGNGATNIAGDITYYNLNVYPGGASVTHTLGTAASQTIAVDGDLNLGGNSNAASTVITASTNNPTMTLKGNVTVCAATCSNQMTYTNGSNTITWSTSGFKTWTDNNPTTKQDLGRISISGGSASPEIRLGSSVSATAVTVALSHELDANGANTLTLTGNSTVFTVSGTFTYSTGTVEYIGTGGFNTTITSLTGTGGTNGYYNLTFSPTISGGYTYTAGGAIQVNNDFSSNPSSSGANVLTFNLGGALTVVGSATLQGTGAGPGRTTLNTISGSNHAINAGNLNIVTNSTLTANNSQITLNGTSGVLFTRTGTFTAGGSTVVMNPDAAVTLTSGTFQTTNAFNHLSLLAALDISGRTYTFGAGAITVNGNMTVNPNAGGVVTLTVNMGAAISVTGTTTITGDTANSNLSTTGTNYALTTGTLDIQANGTLTANGSTITINGTSGTPFTINGTFTAGTSTVDFKGNGNITIDNATYNNLKFTPTVSSTSKTYTMAVGTLTANGTMTVLPSVNTPLSLTVDLSDVTAVTGDLNIANTGTGSTVFNTNNNQLTVGSLTLSEFGAATFNGGSSSLTSNGDVVINTGGVLVSTSGTFNVKGDWTNSGTFTDSSGAVLLSGGAKQTLSGTMTGASDFNHLTITNNSGSDPQTDPSIDFDNDATISGTLTITTASVKVQFNASGTYNVAVMTINGAAAGTRVTFRSSTSGTQYKTNLTGSRPSTTISYLEVKDSDACDTPPDIDASNGTNQDAGNNRCWLIKTLSVTLAGDPVALGTLLSSQTNFDAITSTVTTNANAGYASHVKFDAT
ncbi:MAG: hypothetical protein HYY50_04560, partial [Candidatus Kerfeldbacteria bacterium]|nr:hypothetical protein [Candidatus Kerfeldbacteria bacterium]